MVEKNLPRKKKLQSPLYNLLNNPVDESTDKCALLISLTDRHLHNHPVSLYLRLPKNRAKDKRKRERKLTQPTPSSS